MMNDVRSRPVNYQYLVAIIISFVFVNAFTVYFIRQERYIYNWDMLAYWDPYIELGRSLIISPLGTVKSILLTIRYSDYNDLPVLPLLPFYYIFGETRLGYILAISNMYLLPAMLILFYLTDKIINSYRQSVEPRVFWVVFITILIFGPLWIPTLRGYPDVIGNIFIGLVLLIYLRTPLEKQNFVLLLLTALFLFIMSINRRYYNFWVEGFFVAAFIERSLSILLSGGRNYKAYFNLIKNLIILAVIYLVLDVLITGPMFKRQLTTHWSEIYGAYQQSSSWLIRCLEFYKHFGLLYSALAIIGLVISSSIKPIRRFVLFLVLQAIITIVSFTRIQSFDPHQYLLICPEFLIFTAVFLDRSLTIFQNLPPRIVFVVLYLVFIVSMFAYSFVPNFTVPKSIVFLYPTEIYKPFVRDDLKEIDRLIEYIEKLSADKPGATFYLLSSSELWNSSILLTAVRGKFEDPTMAPRIDTTSDVDKRDGFPLQFFTADYVITAEPFQYHLNEKNQRVITIPSEKIRNRDGIGLNYKELPESFHLDDNITLHVFEREKPPDYETIRNTLKDFLAYYPEMSDRYKVLPLDLFVAEDAGPAGNANVKYLPDDTVSIKLSSSTPAEVVYGFNGDLNSMRITPSLGEDCGNESKAELYMAGDRSDIIRIAVSPDSTESFDVDLAGVDRLKISAMSTGSESCDTLKVKIVSQDWKSE